MEERDPQTAEKMQAGNICGIDFAFFKQGKYHGTNDCQYWLLHDFCPFLSKGRLPQCLQQKEGDVGVLHLPVRQKAAKQRASAVACSYTLEQGFAQQSKKKQRCRYWRRTSRHVNKRQVLRSHQAGGRQCKCCRKCFRRPMWSRARSVPRAPLHDTQRICNTWCPISPCPVHSGRNASGENSKKR